MSKKTVSDGKFRRLSSLLLLFGTYAVLCQTVMILLFVCTAPSSLSLDVVRHTVIPWLEYPLMSLVLLFGGAVLIRYTEQ